MTDPFCPGRDAFEDMVPFGSDKNRCPLGMDSDCERCRFYHAKLYGMRTPLPVQ